MCQANVPVSIGFERCAIFWLRVFKKGTMGKLISEGKLSFKIKLQSALHLVFLSGSPSLVHINKLDAEIGTV